MRKTKNQEKTHFYKGLSDIWIFNFDEIAKTSNYSYLVVGYNGYDEVEFDYIEAQKLWKKLYNDFCKLSNDNTSLLYYELLDQLGYLKTRKLFVLALLNQLKYFKKSNSIRKQYIFELSEWEYVIDPKNPLEDELKKMYQLVRANDNKIGLVESEIAFLKDDEQESMSLVKQAIKLAQGLGKERIDTKDTTVEYWLELFEELRITNEYRRKVA